MEAVLNCAGMLRNAVPRVSSLSGTRAAAWINMPAVFSLPPTVPTCRENMLDTRVVLLQTSAEDQILIEPDPKAHGTGQQRATHSSKPPVSAHKSNLPSAGRSLECPFKTLLCTSSERAGCTPPTRGESTQSCLGCK